MHKKLWILTILVAPFSLAEDRNLISLNHVVQAENFAPRRFLMTVKGTILINDANDALHEFSTQGDHLGSLLLPDEFPDFDRGIATFAFVPRFGGLYLISALNQNNRESLTYRIFVYNNDKVYIGQAIYRGNGPLAIANLFIQLLVEDDRLFINRWHPNFMEERPPYMLHEVTLRKKGKFFYIQPIGNPFDPLMEESTNFATQFKMRWIAKRPEGPYYVMDQLQPRAWPYHDSGGSFQMGRQVPVFLQERVLPHRYYDRDTYMHKARFDGLNEREKISIWHNSFTKVTGFYTFGNGYIVSYTAPNPQFHAYQSDSVNTARKDDTSKFLLFLRVLGKDLQPSGTAKAYPGAYMVGVFQDACYVFHPRSDMEQSHQLEVLFPYQFEAE